MVSIETERLLLRNITLEDIPALYQIRPDNVDLEIDPIPIGYRLIILDTEITSEIVRIGRIDYPGCKF